MVSYNTLNEDLILLILFSYTGYQDKSIQLFIQFYRDKRYINAYPKGISVY